MPTPFRLTFDFTPKSLGNRERVRDEQFTVTVKDISIMRRLEVMESLLKEAPDVPETAKDHKQTPEEFLAAINGSKKQSEWKRELAKKFIVRVNGLSAIDADEKTVEVKTAAQLEEYCPDVLQEVADRLLFGAGEEELKNSPSLSSAASSAPTASAEPTSTASAT